MSLSEHYTFSNGWTAKREYEGETENGNPYDGRWVLRDETGKFIDVDKYRHDQWERYDLEVVSER